MGRGGVGGGGGDYHIKVGDVRRTAQGSRSRILVPLRVLTSDSNIAKKLFHQRKASCNPHCASKKHASGTEKSKKSQNSGFSD